MHAGFSFIAKMAKYCYDYNNKNVRIIDASIIKK